ncbi:MAG: V-type ATP synthase subunit D [Spirochaetia bacterium]
MAKVKFTKNELKKQKDALKRFQRYLPTLMLKKQQLQVEIRQVEARLQEKLKEKKQLKDSMLNWIAVFGEPFDLDNLLSVESIETGTGNIAGIDIPLFKEITFSEEDYSLFDYPLWVDSGLEALKDLIRFDAEIEILEKQKELLEDELRITSQRVNLFEKVKIPETKENIRMISIFLGDQQTAAVVRGKIAKSNIVRA